MKRDREYYRSKGFDARTADYFANGRRRIVSVVANDDFTLTLTFDNHEKRLLNAKPFLRKGTVFEPFLDLKHFKRVYLDEDSVVSWDIDPEMDSHVVWNNKVDIAPESCYLDSHSIK